jgi:hypothetical protein
MSQSIDILTLRGLSAGAIARGRGVTFADAQAAAAGAKIKGIAQHATTAAGQDVAITICGTAIVEVGAAVTLGASLTMDAQGRAVAAVPLAVASGATAMTSAAANGVTALTGGDAPQFVFGDALQAATAAGQFIEVLLRR